MFKVLLPLLMLISVSAQARVFDINKEGFAGYIGFTGGPSAVGKSAFEDEAGSSVTYTNEVKYNYSGEFGFLYSRPAASMRFGFEILKPQSLNNLVGHGSGGDLYSESSDLMGYIPKLTLEVNLRRDQDSRSFVTGSIGYATVTLKNSYTLTAAGNAAYPGMDQNMEAKGTGILWSASIGHELLMTDTTTFLFELGYRRLTVNNLKYTRSGSYFGNSVNDGDDVLKNGSSREIDLSGLYLGATFRFYL